jgi:hypothetical protein
MQSYRILQLAAAVALTCLCAGAAQAACYAEQPGPPVLTCSGKSGNSADFAQTCSFVAGPPIQVEVQCPGRWVNVVSAEDSHSKTCSRAGLKPANISGQICASGERQPSTGENWNGINYRYGKWGSSSNGGTLLTSATIYLHRTCAGGHDSGPCDWATETVYMCWMGGQKQDNDATDKVVAYYCE